MDSLLKDSNRNGLISQMVKRIADNEAFVRKHSMLKHQNYVAPTSSLLYSSNGSTAFSAVETTVFSVSVPTGFFTSSWLRFHVYGYTVATTPRVLTVKLKIGATTITEAAAYATGTNSTKNWVWDGSVTRVAANSQRGVFVTSQAVESTALAAVYTDGGGALISDAAPMTIAFTLQLAGAVTTAYFTGVLVESVP